MEGIRLLINVTICILKGATSTELLMILAIVIKDLHFTSLHLSPGAKLAHRASTCALHQFLSCAAMRTPLQDCHPALDLSFLFPSGRPAVTYGVACCNCSISLVISILFFSLYNYRHIIYRGWSSEILKVIFSFFL